MKYYEATEGVVLHLMVLQIVQKNLAEANNIKLIHHSEIMIMKYFSLLNTILYLKVFKNLKIRIDVRMVPRGGIEPPTQGFSVLCSTN